MKKFFGNTILGLWFEPLGDHGAINQNNPLFSDSLIRLDKAEDPRLSWAPTILAQPNGDPDPPADGTRLWPHLNGVPLIYDEEA